MHILSLKSCLPRLVNLDSFLLRWRLDRFLVDREFIPADADESG